MALQLATAAINTARDAHYELNPVSGLYERTLLLEGARTNALTYSEDMTNVIWAKFGIAITANATTAPEGTATADKIAASGGGPAAHYLSRGTGSFTDSANQSFSVYVKSGELSRFRFYVTNGGATAGVAVSVPLLSISNFSVGPGSISQKSLTYIGGGWYRVTATVNLGAGVTSATMVLMLINNADTSNFSEDGSGLYPWGFQFEADATFASSYIPTTTVAVTRAADSLSFPFTLAPQEATVYAKFIERGTINLGTAGAVLQIGSNTDPRLLVYALYNKYTVYHHNGVASVTSATGTAPVIGNLVELRVVIGSNGAVTIAQAINGAAEVTGATSAANALGPAWASATLYVARTDAGAESPNAFLALKVARGTKSLAQMRALAPVS